MRYLLFDASNVLYRTFYAHKDESELTIAGLAANSALTTLNKYYKMHKPCKPVMCFDRHSWRKDYTKSPDCITRKPYKGHRRQNMTRAQQEKYQMFLEHLDEFEELMTKHTGVICLANEGLEADDLLAGTIQTLSVKEPDSEFIVISQDKDLIQLLRYDNVTLIDPATGKARDLEDWNGDVELFMFEKCIRGDAGDNVQSAYPRIRTTRIHKAYEDDYERTNIMNHKWVLPPINDDQDEKEVTVKDLFKENILLMDLEEQPDDVKLNLIKTVLEGLNNPGKFNYITFLKFLGKYEMKRVSENAENFVPMLNA